MKNGKLNTKQKTMIEQHITLVRGDKRRSGRYVSYKPLKVGDRITIEDPLDRYLWNHRKHLWEVTEVFETVEISESEFEYD